jgi:hypothetical protein
VCAFVALCTQHAMCIHHVTMASPARHYFSTLSHKRHDFRKKKVLNLKSVFRISLQLLSKTFFILRIIERDIIKNAYLSSRKVPFILIDDGRNYQLKYFLVIFVNKWIYRVIRNDCRGFNNLSYTIHLRYEYTRIVQEVSGLEL